LISAYPCPLNMLHICVRSHNSSTQNTTGPRRVEYYDVDILILYSLQILIRQARPLQKFGVQ
jgi:hypothetical protein